MIASEVFQRSMLKTTKNKKKPARASSKSTTVKKPVKKIKNPSKRLNIVY
jgi:hypothetical protein